MGKKYSKADDDNEEEESKLYDRKKIYFDEFGNFCLGEDQFDPEEEMMRIMACDDNDEEDGKEWCIINTPWMKSWMLYCHLNKDVNPNPGPCRNGCLLEVNEEGTAWVPKADLVLARKDKEGDYRRISKAAWDVFCELYPGSGPEIKVEFYEDEEHKSTGTYDTSAWKIDQSTFEPHVTKPKKLFGGFGLGDKKKGSISEASGPVDEGLPDEGATDIAMVEMEEKPLSEEKRENISEFFGRKADSRVVSSTGTDEAKYEAAPTGVKATEDTPQSSEDDMNKWLFEE